jgi:hypothetical protein
MDEDDFELGEDVTDVFIAPRNQRGVVLSVRFNLDEADAVFRCSEFWNKLATQYVKDLVLAEVYRPQVRVEQQ